MDLFFEKENMIISLGNPDIHPFVIDIIFNLFLLNLHLDNEQLSGYQRFFQVKNLQMFVLS